MNKFLGGACVLVLALCTGVAAHAGDFKGFYVGLNVGGIRPTPMQPLQPYSALQDTSPPPAYPQSLQSESKRLAAIASSAEAKLASIFSTKRSFWVWKPISAA